MTLDQLSGLDISGLRRLARNRLDDAMIHAALRDANISLVSVTENLDETPLGC